MYPVDNTIFEAARDRWNEQADEYNQWDELGSDEKLNLLVVESINRDGVCTQPTDRQ